MLSYITDIENSRKLELELLEAIKTLNEEDQKKMIDFIICLANENETSENCKNSVQLTKNLTTQYST